MRTLPDTLTASAVAKQVECSERTVRYACESGECPAGKQFTLDRDGMFVVHSYTIPFDHGWTPKSQEAKR